MNNAIQVNASSQTWFARGSQWLLAVSAVLLIVTLASQWAPPLLTMLPGTQIRCAVPVFHAGEVFHGQEVQGAFVIQNSGRTAVTVRKVTTSCGCTTVADAVEGRRLEAGASLTVPVTWTVSQQPGKQSKTVTVHFQEWNDWSLTLRMEGDVLPAWTMVPGQISLGTLSPDAEVTREARLTFTEGAPIQAVQRIQCSHAHLRVTLIPVDNSTALKVAVQTLPPLSAGRLNANIYLHTTGDSIVLPVAAWVEAKSAETDDRGSSASSP